ncbi:hypothetical protein KIN20_032912 [Parelaphostrongylus tenuis]|uniref:Lysozyme n=1 Tax=Parelaphostrongylus tenuis TaxID=148309 RepID=A0AAD5R7T9_PARTN|nr:hypothetical protein KIN20_032912 [Parelaphostrongylus tenuis]
MKSLILAFVLGCSCGANPPYSRHNAPSHHAPNSFYYALDLSQPVSLSSFACIRQNRYTGLGLEIYMTPQPNSRKTGAMQLDEMYHYLTRSGIDVVTVWIQVTSPMHWSTSVVENVNFILSIVARAKQYRLRVGIYTNYYDWSLITNGLVLDGTMLWYWSVYAPGLAGESQPNFVDFQPFACWSAPAVKQFAHVESVCGVTVNRCLELFNKQPKCIRCLNITNDCDHQGIESRVTKIYWFAASSRLSSTDGSSEKHISISR